MQELASTLGVRLQSCIARLETGRCGTDRGTLPSTADDKVL